MADDSDYATILQQLLARPIYGQQQPNQSWTQDLSDQASRFLQQQVADRWLQQQYPPQQQPVNGQEGGYTIAPPPPGGWTPANLAASGLPGATLRATAGFYGLALPDQRLDGGPN